jgi:peptidoglycan/LPS O-acetylase OafA/YrhL
VAVNSGERRSLGKLPALDGLRGVAILLVIGDHAAIPHMVLGGQVGVTVFFVLSGFLITSQLVARDRVDFRGFWIRRARRLGPALLVMLAVCFPLFLGAGWTAAAYWRDALPGLLYVQNLHEMAAGWMLPFGHLWSLSVEEQFYLVFPFVVALLRSRPRAVLWFSVLVGAVSAGARFWLSLDTTTQLRGYFGLDTNAYALLLGAGLAAGVALGWRPSRQPLLLLAGVLLVTGATVYPPTTAHPYLVVLPAAAGAGLLIAAALAGPIPALEWRPLRFCGRVSYGWYLWQGPLLSLTWPTTTTGNMAGKVTVCAVALGVAVLSWRCVEQPILRSGRLVGEVVRDRVVRSPVAG